MDYNRLLIRRYESFSLFLNQNQSYLGWVYILHNKRAESDILDITEKERRELFHIAKHAKCALLCSFRPDKFNYASLCNVFQALHMHVITRYKGSRTFAGKRFSDPRWGMNYSPYDKSYSLTAEVVQKIKTEIARHLPD